MGLIYIHAGFIVLLLQKRVSAISEKAELEEHFDNLYLFTSSTFQKGEKVNTYLTTREISEDLNISVATLHRYRVRGTGPEFYQLPGGTYRYPRDRYEAWKREQFALRSFA